MNVALAFLRLTAPHWGWALVTFIVACAAVALYYWRTVPPLRPRLKVPLVVLRLVAAVALFLALADGLWSAVAVDLEKGEAIVLLDRSASMNETDGEATPRHQRAAALLETEITDRLSDRADIRVIPFAEAPHDPSEPLPDSFGRATAIGDALLPFTERSSELADARALVILSDGANNRGVDPVDVVGRLGLPVVAVGVGRPGGVGARVVSAKAPDVVYTGQPFAINAELQTGTDSGQVTVQLSLDGRTVKRERVGLSTPGARVPVPFEATVDVAGMHAARLDLIKPNGEVVPTAGRTLFVSALKDRLRVLLIGFVADWEYATLKRYLSAQERVELIDHVAGHPDWGRPLPSPSEWDDIDIAIYLHPTRDELQEYWAPYAGALSQRGKGVAFLLDGRFARPGPVTCPYPLEFCRALIEEVRGEYVPDPVPTRQNHPLVRLDPAGDWEQTRRLWIDRPPWAHVVVFDSVAANADILVRTAVTTRRTDTPIFWTRPLGRGRSLVLAAGPIWRWSAEQAAAGRAPEEYAAFWSNALQWLTLSDDADRLAVRTDRDVYHSGEAIALEGLVFDEAYRFLDRAEVTARVWRDTVGADTVSLLLNPGAGDRFAGRLSALAAGNYRYNGTAIVSGETLPLTGGVFRVESYGLEEQYAGLDEPLLRAVAAQSGPAGRYFDEQQPLTYLDSLDWSVATRERPVEFPLGNHWLVLAIFIATLSAEWFIRRRQQLL